MLDLLRTALPKCDFDVCWCEPPPYEVFLDAVVRKIGTTLAGQVTELTCSAKSNGNRRIRLDCRVLVSGTSHSLYVDFVWLPDLGIFRGTASLRPADFLDTQQESSDDDELVPVFVPSLGSLLAEMEQRNKSPLTQEEVLAVRDRAICIALRRSVAQEMEKRRGYRDIAPENCWEEWLELRKQLANG